MVYAHNLNQGETAMVIAYHSETDKLKMYALGILPKHQITIFSNQKGNIILYTTKSSPKVGLPREIASHLEVTVTQ